MKRLYTALAIISLALISGCATSWQDKSDVEKQAWIFSGAIIVAAAFLAEQEDVTNIGQDNCFESKCER